MASASFDYRDLSVDERLQLVGDIWDSIAEEANVNPEVLPLSRQLKDELDRRVAEHDADPSRAVPMAEVMERIRARLRDR